MSEDRQLHRHLTQPAVRWFLDPAFRLKETFLPFPHITTGGPHRQPQWRAALVTRALLLPMTNTSGGSVTARPLFAN